MSTQPVVLSAPALSQTERVVDVFIAPSKTFHDILRSASWWLPAVLMILFSIAQTAVIEKKVGWDQVTENQLHNSPKSEERMAQLTAEARAQQTHMTTAITRGFSYGSFVLILAGFAFYALVLWGGFNFILGARTTFPQVFATTFYASLPYLLLNVLVILTLLFGNNAEAFDLKNPAGTNLAYYMPDASPILRALLARIDLIQLWTLALTVYGMAIIAKKTIAQSALIVGSWWFLITLLTVAGAAFS